MHGLKCENQLEKGKSLDEQLPVAEWLALLAERVGTQPYKRVTPVPKEAREPATLISVGETEPSGMALRDIEFDHMQSVLSIAVAQGKLDGFECVRLGNQIERLRSKMKGGMLAAIAGKTGGINDVPGYAWRSK